MENGSAKCRQSGARISPKNSRTRLSSVTETMGATPRWAAWQRRQFGSSCPPECECGTTWSRKKRETSASEKAAHAASRRFRRASVNRVMRPLSKYDLSRSRGQSAYRPMNSLSSTKRIDARTELDSCPVHIDASGCKKDGFFKRIYSAKALGLAVRSAVRLAAICPQTLRISSSVGFLSSSYLASGT